jgi:hypothetical protein
MKEAVSAIEKSLVFARADIERFEREIKNRREIISNVRERYKADIKVQFFQLETSKKYLAEHERKRDELKEALVILALEDHPEF